MWVRAFGVSELAKRIGANRTTVQSWLRSAAGKYSYTPSPRMSMAVIELSKHFPCGVGPLDSRDVYEGLVQ
jgi:transposase-like protein